MGGGRGYFDGKPLRDLQSELRAARERTQNLVYDAECNQALQTFLADFNKRDADLTARHLEDIKAALEGDLEGTVDFRFGGSVAKHTYVDGFSDVDSLVLLNRSELADVSPPEAKRYLADRLRDKLPKLEIREGAMAVTVSFPDADLQLVPAIRTSEGYRISDAKGSRWTSIRPQEFGASLSQLNEKLGAKLVPVVKLAKAIVATLPENHQLSGYHTEALALEVFDGYQGQQTHRAMLRHFFTEAVVRVRSPIRDITGQSRDVDEYLGKEGSFERRIVADALDRIARRMANADVVESVQQWQGLFEA